MDRLEPDKGKQARLLTDHMTGEWQLPSTEQELHQHLENQAQKEYKKQIAATEAAKNWAATQQAEAEMAALEAAMATHLAQTTRAAALAARATTEQADAEAAKAAAEAIGGRTGQHTNLD